MRLDSLHPVVPFVFFLGAVVLSVLVTQPLLQLVDLLLAAGLYGCLRGRTAGRALVALVPVLLVLTAVNPLFNTQGETVLFTWWGGRPYTAQALAFGASTAAMFATVLLWFFSFNIVMESDKLTYLFGGLAPALTLVFTMVLRLVPTYQRKAGEIAAARGGIGRSAARGSLRQRVRSGTAQLSALVSWALEGSIVTADSMRSRGYGAGRRTHFARYRFTGRDGAMLAVLVLLALGALASVAVGAQAMEWFPAIAFPPVTPWGMVGTLCFGAFLAAPLVLDRWEVARWRISLSKI